MSRIRRPTVYGLHVILLRVALQFNGRLGHDLAVVEDFCHEYNMDPEVALKVINGWFPTTATDSRH